jgi:4-hydroxyacetophenone monooxygenase
MNDEASEIRRKLDGANVVPLAMALAQLSGDLSVLDDIAPHVRGAWEHLESVPAPVAARVRDRLVHEMLRVQAGGAVALPQPDQATLQRMMSVAAGEPVAQEYMPMVLEHMGLSVVAEGASTAQPRDPHAAPMRVAIIGAGASGLCAAIRLGELGIGYTVFEKNEDIGGTWFENRYPGCAVDTPNHFYQFSFEPNNDWSHYFSQQESIRAYLSRCADKYRVREHVHFGVEVHSAHWQEASGTWRLEVRDRTGLTQVSEFDAIVCAVGQLNRPKIPDFPGLKDFQGEVLHTAAWPEGADLRGKRVALLGTGASAVQVGPAIVDEVASLHVIQRSGSWVTRRPNIDRAVSEDKKWALNNVPFYAAWYRFQLFWAFGDGLFEALKIDPQWPGGRESINATNAKVREAMLRHIRKELDGRPDLIEKVVPDYPPFGKRVLGDAGWFRMLRRDHVSLVTQPVESVDAHGIVLKDGTRIDVDAIVMATGFHAGRMLWPMDIRGRSGASIREVWGEDNPRAYLGITVPDYPNLFVLFGPNTNVGHGGSAIFLAECQMNYTVKLLQAMRASGERVAEVRRDVHDRYNEVIDEKLRQLSWSHPAVTTWYKNGSGRIVTNQPWRLVEYWELTREPKLDEYRLGHQAAAQPVPTP